MNHNNAPHAIPAVTPRLWQLSLLLVMLLLAACSSVQPRRDDPAACVAGGACNHSMVEHGDGFRLGYLQFDDEGRYAQPGQLEHVLNDIRAVSGNGLILVAFTHGWKENSGADRWSVSAFRKMLAAIGEREQRLAAGQDRAPRAVAGVFLGWPGRVATLPGLNGLTWFDRADAAQRIARADFGDALQRLKELRDATTSASGGTQRSQPGNALILAGHSLGATMLYQHLVQEPLRSRATVLTPIADLVLLLSPAIPAARLGALEDLPAARQSVLPTVMAITSAGDVTLRVAFPFATWLESEPGTAAAEDLPRFRAMGTHAPLITHHLDLEGSELVLAATGTESPHAALLQIAASETIMRGHKDIANPRLVEFVADVAALQLDNRLDRSALASAFPAR